MQGGQQLLHVEFKMLIKKLKAATDTTLQVSKNYYKK